MRRTVLIFMILVIGILVAGCTQGTQPATSTPAPTAAAGTPAVPTAEPNSQTSVAPGSVIVPNITPVIVPPSGVFIYVNYLGSFSGAYGTANSLTSVRDSGERLYPLDPVNGTIVAGFAKADGSSHPLTVMIYQDSRILSTGTSSDPDGMVNLTANAV